MLRLGAWHEVLTAAAACPVSHRILPLRALLHSIAARVRDLLLSANICSSRPFLFVAPERDRASKACARVACLGPWLSSLLADLGRTASRAWAAFTCGLIRR